MNNYLFQFIIFLFVYFTQIQSDSTGTYTSSINNMSTITTVPNATSQSSSSTVSSTVTSTSTSNEPTTTTSQSSSSTLSSTVTSTPTSNEPNPTNSPSVTSSSPMNSTTYIVSMGTNASTEYFTSSNTMHSSTYTSPTGTNASTGYSSSSFISTGSSTSLFTSTAYSSMTSQSINISVNLTYKYDVQSSSQLKSGYTTNSTILASVQVIVRSSFNLTGFTITVISVEIKSGARTFINTMFTNILFTSSRNDCDETCIKNSQLSTIPTGKFMLLAADGSLVTASAASAPLLVQTTTSTTTTPIVNYPKGESPPGLAGQLGMGLGITFMGIIVIVLVVYLYRKYGFNNRRNPSDYELTTYDHRLSV